MGLRSTHTFTEMMKGVGVENSLEFTPGEDKNPKRQVLCPRIPVPPAKDSQEHTYDQIELGFLIRCGQGVRGGIGIRKGVLERTERIQLKGGDLGEGSRTQGLAPVGCSQEVS